MEVYASRARNREAIPSIRGLLPTGADLAGVRFRGWEVAEHRSIEILDSYVKEADSRYQVLSTDKIRENQGAVWQASLGSASDPLNYANCLSADSLAYHLETNIVVYQMTGMI